MKISPDDRQSYSTADLERDRPEWKIGTARLSVFRHKPTQSWLGVVQKPAQFIRFRSDDLGALICEMEAETSLPPPTIRGYKGAVDRFLHLYPGGFTNDAFTSGERGGKAEAGELLQPIMQTAVPEPKAISLLKSARSRLNKDGQSPLHMTENSDLDRAWAGPSANLYLSAVRALAAEPDEEGFELMSGALEGGRCSWPMVTLFPALLAPTTNAILRPEPAKTFARAVRSTFAEIYDPQPSAAVYEAYLRLLDGKRPVMAALRQQVMLRR